MVTVEDVVSRLQARAANYDMTVGDLLEKIPSNVVDSHTEVNDWLDQKDISHKFPTSTHPELVNDPNNWTWEDSSVNRARQDDVMTDFEVLQAQIDNDLDASLIDGNPYDSPDSEWVDVLIDSDIPLEFPDPDIWRMW